jgi:NADH-quinone oxidoreductase subunit F
MNDPTTAATDRPTVRVTVSRAGRSDDAGAGAADGAAVTERGRRELQAARSAADGATVREVGSPGVRALEPLVLVSHDGRTAYHPRPSLDRVEALVEDAAAGDVSAEDARWVVEHDPDVGSLPSPADGPLAVGRRRALGGCGWVDPEDGSSAVDTVGRVREAPGEALDRLRTLGVLGRGRGDASRDDPVAETIETVRGTGGDPVVVVNANESDRRNETDRTLLCGTPGTVLGGALAIAELVGAAPSDVVVYTNEADALARRRTRRAARSLADAVEGADPPQVVSGPDEYVAGEFTMALEALEGNDRLEARLRPPGPARHGLYGRPTAVHTPRTYAQLYEALVNPAAFDGSAADPGTRLVTVSGDVAAPATVELPTGGSLAAVRDAVDAEGRVKMACVGGQFGGFTGTLDHGASALALRDADLGTEGAVELMNDDRCALATVGERVRFASEENCGRCFPCREGSKQLLDLLRDVYDGSYDDDMIQELTRTVGGSSICDFGRSAARSVGTAVRRFETEFEAHAEGRCPSGDCEVARS